MTKKSVIDWGPLVQKALSEQQQRTIERKKLVKLAVKLANASDKSIDKRTLKDELQTFLDRSHTFAVENGRIYVAKEQQQSTMSRPAPVALEPLSAATPSTQAAASALEMLGAAKSMKRKTNGTDVELAAREVASMRHSVLTVKQDAGLQQGVDPPLQIKKNLSGKETGHKGQGNTDIPVRSARMSSASEMPAIPALAGGAAVASGTATFAQDPTKRSSAVQAGQESQPEEEFASEKKARKLKKKKTAKSIGNGHAHPPLEGSSQMMQLAPSAADQEDPQDAAVPLIRSQPADQGPVGTQAHHDAPTAQQGPSNKSKKKGKRVVSKAQKPGPAAGGAGLPSTQDRDPGGGSPMSTAQGQQQGSEGSEGDGSGQTGGAQAKKPRGKGGQHSQGTWPGSGGEEGGGGDGDGQKAEHAARQSRGRKRKNDGQGAGGSAPNPTQRKGATPVLPAGAAADVKRWREANKREDVKSGPFSKADKDTLRQAVLEYAEQHGHSTTDFSWLFDRTQKRTSRSQGAWSIIAEALPQRTYKSVWAAGTRMFHPGNYQGRFTADEDVRLQQLVSEKGSAWKEIGAALGRMPQSCRDRWREIRLGSEKKVGHWSDEEVAKLKEAVQEYLALKKAHSQPAGSQRQAGEVTVDLGAGAPQATPPATASGDRPLFEDGGDGAAGDSQAGAGTPSRRQVLDDVDWGVVSSRVGTRSDIQCLEKWYSQLCPSMVERGEWGSGDDRRLLRAIHSSGAAQDYELDWGSIVPGRDAAQTRRRWRLMLKCVPGSRDMDFGEVVDQLVTQYMPHLKEKQP